MRPSSPSWCQFYSLGFFVQSLGRSGYRKLGVGSSGALDSLAVQVGNVLLGNGADAPSIEMLLFPIEVRFQASHSFAVTGNTGKIFLDGKELPPWWRATGHEGQILRIESSSEGGIGYLTIGGKIDIESVLRSASTDLKGGFGGHQGRMLKAGDLLNIRSDKSSATHYSFGASPPGELDSGIIRFLPGFEIDQLAKEHARAFYESVWTVSRQSSRIGFKLEGPQLQFSDPIELLSYGVLPGLIQLPPGGQPIVLLADAQTSGGYPRLGSVISSDLRLVAQSSPGKAIQFRQCSFAEAAEAEADEQDYLDRLSNLREVICP
ncbi:biotin-dependent carboxyltransferase family protein [Pseudomonas sp. EpS/L25]|uniref:5-oxoprolinase subunit C family protein n=1 Tax=Pseudomonas sp. EpS/L25 TaxID=1749078 RepID=UPI0009E7154B